MSGCPAAAPSASSSRRWASRETRNPQGRECRARRAPAGHRRHRYRQWRTAAGQGRRHIAADPLRAELAKQLRMGKSGTIEVGGKKLFLNVYAPTARLVIVGAVHISQALAPLARSLDYDVTVVDPRTAFASPERFPDVPLIAEWPDVALPPLNIDHYTAFVALTHDPKIDDPALLHAFARDCFYIGALGSRKTHAKRGERLKAQGATDADIARIHAPIGLAIGAVSPSEIAVSIMAEITAQLRLPQKKENRRHEVRSRQSGRRDRRRHRPHPASGIAGAEEGHHDRRRRGRGARQGRRQGSRRGAAGAGRRLRRRRRRQHRAGGRRRRRQCRARLHRPRQSVRGQGRRAGGGPRRGRPHQRASTKPSPSRRSPPSSRWSKAR